MFDAQRMFHVGVRVHDLDAAMDELGAAANLTWAEPRSAEMAFWTPEGGVQSTSLRFVYSCDGPQHVELLQSAPGSLWYPDGDPGIHHVGFWAGDVAAEVEAAVDHGWRVDLASLPPDEGYGMFAYVRPPSGLLVEFVTDEILPAFEEWWAAGRA